VCRTGCGVRMEKKERAANLHASALRRELDRCLESAPPTCASVPSEHTRGSQLPWLLLLSCCCRTVAVCSQDVEADTAR
jgi:hypothetical protein